MKTPRMRVNSRIAAAAAAAALAGGAAVATASPAWASSGYGKGEVYQIELSANISGTQGGGAWLWIGLNSNGTGDYSGSDCGHGGVGGFPDSGDVTWKVVGNQVVISGVVLNGFGGYPATVTVPAAYGHYIGTVGSYITLPIPGDIGTSELQVAP